MSEAIRHNEGTVVAGVSSVITMKLRAAGAAVVAMALLVTACSGGGETAEAATVVPETGRAAAAASEPSAPTGADDASERDRDPAPEPSATPDRESPSPTVDTVVVAAPTPEPVSYDGSFASTIQPILEEKCSSCHYEGGPGAFHWNLRTAQDVVDTHLLVEHVVVSASMPPWPASTRSVAFNGDRSLRPDQVQAILDWAADGASVDVEPSTPIGSAADQVRLLNPNLIIEPVEAYTGTTANRDDHRCLIYDPELDEGGWLTGYEFRPDQTAVVHHAVGFVMPASARMDAEARDGADGRPGWACPGAVGVTRGVPAILWTPGQDATVSAEGAGWRIPPGGFFVMQIHYHYDGEAPADRSSVALTIGSPDADLEELDSVQLVAPVEIPCASWESGPLCDRDAALADATARFGARGVLNDLVNRVCGVTAADFERFTDGVAESSCTESATYSRSDGRTLQSVIMHMHELGDWTRLTLNKGTPDELVLVDIPDWDFNWQYSYALADPMFLDVSDTLTLECGWDRSLRDADLEPAWVVWAEGTNDEMCTALLTTR